MSLNNCHPQTVRERLHALNDRGLDGLGMKPGSGRQPRLTRSTILALVKRPPPGKPTYELTGELAAPDPEAASEWTLDTLTAVAREQGDSGGAQPDTTYLPARGRAVASDTALGDQQGSRFRPQSPTRARIVALYTAPPPEETVLCVDELGLVTPRTPAHLPARPRLVSGRPPHQSAAG